MTAAWRHVDLVLVGLVAAAAVFGSLMVYSATRHERRVLVRRQARDVRGDRRRGHGPHGRDRLRADRRLGLGHLRRHARRARVGAGARCSARSTRTSGPGSTSGRSRSSRPSSPRSPPSWWSRPTSGRWATVSFRHLVVALVMLGVPMGLIMLQPDLGTTLVFVVIGVGMLVVAGVPMRYLVRARRARGRRDLRHPVDSNTLDQYQKDRLHLVRTPDQASRGRALQHPPGPGGDRVGRRHRPGPVRGTPDQGRVRPRAADRLHLHRARPRSSGSSGSSGRSLLLGGGRLAGLAHRAARRRRGRAGSSASGVLCMFVFHIFENVGHEPRDHAGDRHPAAVRLLRRLGDDRHASPPSASC